MASLPYANNTSPTHEKRHVYFQKLAPKRSRVLYAVSIALGILCILLLLLSTNKFINGSVFKIPMISAVTDFLGIDLNDDVEKTVEKAKDNVDLTLKVLELICKDSEFYENIEGELNLPFDEWEATYGVQPAELRKLFDPLSLRNLTTLLSHFLGDKHIAVSALRVVIGCVIGVAVGLILLATLSTLLRRSWLCLLTCVLCTGFFSFTGGFIIWLFGSAAWISMAVICYKLNREYGQYKKDVLNTHLA